MTNLLLSYPDIPFRAEGTIPSAAADDDYPAHYLISGPKHGQFRFNANQTTGRIVYDLGPNVTAEADHIILGRADILCDGSGVADLQVHYSSDGSAWTSAVSQTNLPAQSRFGAYAQDYVLPFTTTPARRYHRVTLTHGSGSKLQFSKLYLGKFFDFGVEPEAGSWQFQRVEPPRSTFESASGAQHHCRSTWPRYEGRGTWMGLTDAKVAEFMEKIGRYHHRNFVFLYSQTNHEVLEGRRLIYCQLGEPRRIRPTLKGDYQGIEFSFREVL